MSGTIHIKPLQPLADWRRGEPLFKAGMNRTHDIIRGLQQGVDQPVQVAVVPRGGTTEQVAGATRTFSLVNVRDDWLVCREVAADGSLAPTDELTIVAKPYRLQRTPFDGQTEGGVTYAYEPGWNGTVRTATRDSESEQQRVTEDYFPGNLIYAETVTYTGVVFNNEPLLLIETKSERAWAEEETSG